MNVFILKGKIGLLCRIQQNCNLVTELEEPIQLNASNFILEQPHFLVKVITIWSIKDQIQNEAFNCHLDNSSLQLHWFKIVQEYQDVPDPFKSVCSAQRSKISYSFNLPV